jgi:phage-related protein
VWLGASLSNVRSFPKAARGEAGYQLYKIQNGIEPSDWKMMPAVGSGVQEIRIHAGNEYRIMYVARLAEAVYVLHAFEKKTQKTTRSDVEIARVRFQSLMSMRRKS